MNNRQITGNQSGIMLQKVLKGKVYKEKHLRIITRA